jgi:maltooligosyltrehalose synthase
VGSDPADFALDAPRFFARTRRRAEHFPHAMLATATPDHKRGEDLRARLAILSHCPDLWKETATSWSAAHEALRRRLGAPDPGDADMLYQMIVGAWPPDLDPGDREGLADFAERLASWQQKALREAKLRTSWAAPNEVYEGGCRTFLFALFDPESTFPQEAAAFVARIAPAGAAAGLAQTVIKLTMPGVPDIYQGTEFWDFSMVDPDNRRPVDFRARGAVLAAMPSLADVLDRWRDGHLKEMLIARVLAIRRERPGLFAQGPFLPLAPLGRHAGGLVAFMRGTRQEAVLTIALTAPWGLVKNAVPRVPPQNWDDTALEAPAPGPWYNLFTGTRHDGGRLMLRSVMEELPIALLGNFPPPLMAGV